MGDFDFYEEENEYIHDMDNEDIFEETNYVRNTSMNEEDSSKKIGFSKIWTQLNIWFWDLF